MSSPSSSLSLFFFESSKSSFSPSSLFFLRARRALSLFNSLLLVRAPFSLFLLMRALRALSSVFGESSLSSHFCLSRAPELFQELQSSYSIFGELLLSFFRFEHFIFFSSRKMKYRLFSSRKSNNNIAFVRESVWRASHTIVHRKKESVHSLSSTKFLFNLFCGMDHPGWLEVVASKKLQQVANIHRNRTRAANCRYQ